MAGGQSLNRRSAPGIDALFDGAQLRAVLDAAPDAMVIVDPGGRIVLVNSQLERLFGFERHEILGQLIEVLMPERYRAAHIGHRLAYGASPKLRPMGAGLTLFGQRKDGSEFPVEISLSPLETVHGRLITAAIRDVTDRRRAEQALTDKNVELEKAVRTKDQFLASLSHELRTPLNAILGFTGTLLMRMPGPLTSEQESQLTTVQESARRLLSVINDLLDLAKVESGTVALQLQAVSCGAILRDVTTAMRPLADGKRVALVVEAPSPDAMVRGDRRALTQILVSLTSNAVKFTEQGEVRVSVVSDAGGAHIAVSDTGIGIRPDDRARLFLPFEPLDTASARRHQGSGLGLHLSQKLAELLSARITCDSEYGRGSTFTLTVPLADIPGASKDASP